MSDLENTASQGSDFSETGSEDNPIVPDERHGPAPVDLASTAIFRFIESDPPYHQPSTTRCYFLELPPVIRRRIYGLVFRNTSICVDWSLRVNHGEPQLSAGRNFANEILQTCKLIRQEAIPVMRKHVTLVVNPNLYGRSTPVRLNMSPLWMNEIQKIKYFGVPRLRLDLTAFGQLRCVLLEHRIYHFTGPAPPREEVEARIKDQIQRHDKVLFQKGIYGLEDGDGIVVKMSVWLMHNRRSVSIGWAALVDAREMRCLKIEKVLFSQHDGNPESRWAQDGHYQQWAMTKIN